MQSQQFVQPSWAPLSGAYLPGMQAMPSSTRGYVQMEACPLSQEKSWRKHSSHWGITTLRSQFHQWCSTSFTLSIFGPGSDPWGIWPRTPPIYGRPTPPHILCLTMTSSGTSTVMKTPLSRLLTLLGRLENGTSLKNSLELDDHAIQRERYHLLVYLIREDNNVTSNAYFNQMTRYDSVIYGTPLTGVACRDNNAGFCMVFHKFMIGGPAWSNAWIIENACDGRCAWKATKGNF